jgi:autotransporter translocation and assembly factor TamB
MGIVRRLVHALVLVLTLVIGAAAAAIIVSQTAWFKNWLRGYIVAQANNYLNGTLTIERLGGNLFFGIEMENIGVSLDGSEVVAVKDLGLDYNVFNLITRGLSVDNIRLDHPVIYLRREGDTWSLSRLVKKQEQEADRKGPDKPISIDAIDVTGGSMVIDGPVGTSGVTVPKRFDHLDAKLSFKYEPVHYSIEITQVTFRGSDPAIALNALSGGVAVKDDTVFVEKLALKTAESSLSFDGAVQHYLDKPVFNLQISSDKVSLPEIARLVPALAGIKLQPKFQVKADGPLDRLGIEMNVQSSAGEAWGKLTADLMTPGQSASGSLSVKHLDLSAILNNPAQKSDITADTKFDLRAAPFSDLNTLRGTLEVHSQHLAAAGYAVGPLDAKAKIDGRRVGLDARAGAYGASATAAGNVVLPDFGSDAKAQPIAFDLRGQARHVDLRRFPRELKVPAAETNVNAAYHAAGSVTPGGPADVHGDLRFDTSAVAGAQIAEGSTVDFVVAPRGAPIPRDVADIRYSADATVSNLDLQRIGNEFNVAALAVDRYKSTINGHVAAKGSGTTPETMDVTANGTLTDTSILGGRIPTLTFDAAIANDTAHVKANGSFSGFDPAVIADRPDLKGTAGGTLDVDATIAGVSSGVTADRVQARVNATLDPSTVGGLAITRAKVDADYHDSTGDIRTLEVVGRDVNVNASGIIALNETGQSNLEVHADSPSLESLGKLVNQPIVGIGKIDATVTGNKRELHAAGNLTADGFKYSGNGALTASSDFTATVPNLEAENARITATTHATFVSVGGQNINELDAKTTYQQQQIEFDATAKQPQRSLTAAGSVLLHPEHQEIHLRNLDLTSQGVRWQTAPGTEATINYAKRGEGVVAVTVENLKLVNGDQTIAADGAFGGPGDALHVTANNIDVATVDALLLREPQLTGRLNTTSTISGTKDALQVKADFKVEKGGFRQFKYDTFGGTVNYGGKGIDVDARLQQNPTTWIEAKGYVPVAAFSSGTNAANTHRAPGPKEDQFDLHIDSSPIDLGLIQGFTTEITKVAGTLQAKVDVTGAADDPHPNGVVTIQNGAFTVGATGVNYTSLDAKIDLQDDKVHIDQLRLLDNHQKPLTVNGDLAVHELELGGVSIAIKSDDFKVIDNKMGNVRVNSDLRIAGELTAPRVEGSLGLSTGVVNLDPILARFGESAYATEETKYLTADEAAAQGQTAAPSAFEALQMDVHVTVPNDLVVKADDLQAPGSPIGLGALNITLGGDLWANKVAYDQLRLYGSVNTIRGSYDFQGRRFTILRDGTVRFEGTDDLNPALDIRTERVIQAVTARVDVRGTMTQPEIVLTSTPPLPQADILALIVFNQNLNSLGEGQQINLAQRAQALATGALASGLAKELGDALGVDTFEISTAPEMAGTYATLTVGEQVGQNLYVKVEQGIGDKSITNFVLEYELTKWLRLRTNVLQGTSTQQNLFQRAQGSGGDLLFFFSY